MSAIVGKNYELPALDLNFAENKSLIDSVTGRNLITFSRSQSGKEATYVGSDGLIKYAGADEPRFDYDPVSGVCKGLLIEGQRTNLFNNSNFGGSWSLFSNPAPVATIKYNAELAPDGTRSAIELTTYPGWESGLFYVCSGSNDTVSVFVKKGTMDYVQIADNSSNMYCTVNLITGTIGGGLVLNCTPSIIPYPNGWYRVIVANITWGSYIKIGYNGGLVPNGGTVYLWGAQLEEGTYPTSYIPTSGAQVIRNPDNASITGSNFSGWYNQSEGTFFADSKSLPNNLGFVVAVISETGSFNPRSFAIDRKIDSGPGLYSGYWRDYTAGDFPILISSNNQESGKTSLGYGTSGLSFTSNGGNVITNAGTYNFTSPPLAYIIIGSGYSSSVGGTIARLTYWPTRLPDLELQQLTK